MQGTTTARALGAALSLATLDTRDAAGEILLVAARVCITEAFKFSNGNATVAAQWLGVSRRVMFDWITAIPWVAEEKARCESLKPRTSKRSS